MFEDILAAPWWTAEWFGNTTQTYVVALCYCIGLILIFKALQSLVILRLLRAAAHTRTDIDDAFISILQTIRPAFYAVLAVYLALRLLVLTTSVTAIINKVFIVVLVYQAIVAAQILIDYLVRHRTRAKEQEGTQALLRFVAQITKIILWVIGLLFILSNVGVNVTSLVAGLGVGGIAVALAAQNVLSDLFSSLAIYFDQPFRVGDYIVIDNIRGTVRSIGMKTTRIKSLDGEEIIIPNHELTSDRIKNFRRLEERRVAFNIDVTYHTPVEKLKMLPGMIEEIIVKVPNTRFDRVHFFSLNDAALSFRVVFHMTIRGYREYMDARQEINFKIVEMLESEGIALAPSHTITIDQED